MSTPKLFGELLRAERIKHGLTVEKIAVACGVSRSYITLIENDRRLPGKKLLPKLAEALHVNKVAVLNWYLEDLRFKIQKRL